MTMLELIGNDRARDLNAAPAGDGPVLYWMSRDQRVRDNWGLLHAQALAAASGSHVQVVFCLLDRCGNATRRHFDFMLDGLEQVEQDLGDLGIPFQLCFGDARDQLPLVVDAIGAGAVVCDFSPLTVSRARRERLAATLKVPLIEV